MMVTFVSECEKKALPKTRRVLDAFANRIGSRTWQTVITNEGLEAVKKLLRQTASKNTAVSCHWIRSRSRSELVWVVGNRRKFSKQGVVPVNRTQKKYPLSNQEDSWKSAEVIALAAGIAGLFHDFGKASDLFQQKLAPVKNTKNYEAYRHEWVSLRLFQAFVVGQTDQEWLSNLQTITDDSEASVFKRLHKDDPKSNAVNNPFANLPAFAQLVAWLIVSHHKLPMYPKNRSAPPQLEYIERWQDELFGAIWNSWNCLDDWDALILQQNWTFSHNTPLSSRTWRDKASQLVTRAINYHLLLHESWLENRFTRHIARLVLILADHFYSAEAKTKKWQDRNYACYANTDANGLNQKLDEHNIGVASHAYWLARKLPKLKSDLPSLGYDKKFVKHTNIQRFKWQNKAFDLAKSLEKQTASQGFFGINMASTGLGKTLGNARIMYGLSSCTSRCRFNVALGLRTLTLQTGDALAELLKLDETELGVLVGSSAVKRLHKLRLEEATELEKQQSIAGSESLAALISEETHIEYKGALDDGVLSKWLGKNVKLEKLLNAPVLVSTIDYLIPATEGVRGGKQIAPILRLLTSDLVLDEPDDFGLEDLPALCRLVNWAGMLGSRVLLSTATMPPALAYALFSAYQAGRKEYTAVHGSLGSHELICCAWFDEFACHSERASTAEEFAKAHTSFIDTRIAKLKKEELVLRKAALLKVISEPANSAVLGMTKQIRHSLINLHNAHHQQNKQGQRVSVGLVRMANISPLVAVAKALFKMPPPKDFRLHLCVYHGQFPLAIRSHIEHRLDETLGRDDPDKIWRLEEIKQALKTTQETNQLFVVLATSVAEVGRDHDYDWAIAEPSSMRSLIQLAGRIQRHRKQVPNTENLLILSKNLKARRNIQPAYCRPGFESSKRRFADHDLEEMLPAKHYQQITAIPRISRLGGKPATNDQGDYLDFVQLEHWALYQRLSGLGNEKNHASLWWQKHTDWCAELQKLQPFRKSSPEQTFCLYSQSDDENCVWTRVDDTQFPVAYALTDKISLTELALADGVQPWLLLDAQSIYHELAIRLNTGRGYVSRVFGEIRLRHDEKTPPDWAYHPVLGVYEEYDRSGSTDLALEEGDSDG